MCNSNCKLPSLYISSMGKYKFSILFLSLILWSCSVQAFLGNDIFRSGDERLFEIFCVNSSEELHTIGQSTYTHDSLSRQGIWKSILKYFQDNPDGGSGDGFTPPSPDASLVELFQSYFGKCASTDRFLEAVQAVVDANTLLDNQPGIKEDSSYHFDAEDFDGSYISLNDLFSKLVTTVMVDRDYTIGRSLLGKALHVIQKFYSNTNWAEYVEGAPCEGLGVPGTVCGTVAPSGSNTCDKSCQFTPNPEDCADNLIVTDGYLTSGYTHHHVMPSGVDKCSYGSKLDLTTTDGRGGINKATSSYCFSPHAGSHDLASGMAVKNTVEYLNYVRDTIGDNHFRNLFELSFGSALAVLIDTSDSMTSILEQVKLEVAQIVEEAANGGIVPSKYILAAYETGVEYKETEDPDEFLDFVNSLTTSGGTENFWHAAQLTLSRAPAYSDIISFTDEPSDDEVELKDTVISLAESKHSKVYVLYSGAMQLTRTLEGYDELCRSSGGFFVDSSTVDVEDIVNILSSSVQSSKATILLTNGDGDRTFDFPVDNFLAHEESRVGLRVAGDLAVAEILFDGQMVVDLFDQASIDSSGLDIVADSLSRTFIDLTFKPTSVGNWTLHFDSSSSYSISVTANCTCSFLADFRNLDLNTTRPNMKPIQDRPISTSTPLIYAQLSSELKYELNSIDSFSYVTPTGEVLATFPAQSDVGVTDDYWVTTESFPIPQTSFYLRMEGKDSDSNLLWRFSSTLITPASTSVEISASAANMAGAPGTQVTGDFIITNHGEQASIDIGVTDVLNFFTSLSPSSLDLADEESGMVTATFTIPSDASVGSVSQVVVTATSRLDQSKNSAFAQVSVISDFVDTTPPMCEISSYTTCAPEFNQISKCEQGTWSFEGSAQDGDSGLLSIDVSSPDGFGELTLGSNFAQGVTDPVSVSFSASCCIRTTSMKVVDLKGNVASCSQNLPPLQEGCQTIEVFNVSAKMVDVQWRKPCVNWTVHHYDLEFFNLFTNEYDVSQPNFLCQDPICGEEKIGGLKACVEYTANVTAYENDDESTGEVAFYSGDFFTTLEAMPTQARNLMVTEKNMSSIKIEWDAPVDNADCVKSYTVCYSISSSKAIPDCFDVEADEPSSRMDVTIDGLQACAIYSITVQPVTSNGLLGPVAPVEEMTELAKPGEPQNLKISSESSECLKLEWDSPEERPYCVEGYQVTCYTDIGARLSMSKEVRNHNTVTECGLQACTNYNCTVVALGFGNFGNSDPVGDVASTPIDRPPSQPSNFQVSSTTTSSAFLTWSRPDQGSHCVTGYEISWQNQYVNDNGSVLVDINEISYTVSNLLPCSLYTFTIRATTDSMMGDSSSRDGITKDVAPGPPVGLQIVDVQCDSITIEWDDPFNNPQCAATNEEDITEMGPAGLSYWTESSRSMTKRETIKGAYSRLFGNLKQNYMYYIEVKFFSSDGQAGPPATIYGNTLPICT